MFGEYPVRHVGGDPQYLPKLHALCHTVPSAPILAQSISCVHSAPGAGGHVMTGPCLVELTLQWEAHRH